ncbi:MAG: hypothetical protein RQ866_08295, partial [Bacteroidales bacterium]|nr:hypothetical protein [Bacteroidales bacterium]
MQHGDTITGFYVKTVPFIQQVLNTDTGFSHNDNNFSSTPSVEMPHFFTSKEIPKNDDTFHPTPINTENNDWVYGSFVLMLLFILAIKWIYPARVKQMLNAFTLPKNRKLFTRDGNLHNEGFSVLFIFLAVITFSLLVLFSLQSFNILPSTLSSEMKVNYYFSFLLLS